MSTYLTTGTTAFQDFVDHDTTATSNYAEPIRMIVEHVRFIRTRLQEARSNFEREVCIAMQIARERAALLALAWPKLDPLPPRSYIRAGGRASYRPRGGLRRWRTSLALDTRGGVHG